MFDTVAQNLFAGPAQQRIAVRCAGSGFCGDQDFLFRKRRKNRICIQSRNRPSLAASERLRFIEMESQLQQCALKRKSPAIGGKQTVGFQAVFEFGQEIDGPELRIRIWREAVEKEKIVMCGKVAH